MIIIDPTYSDHPLQCWHYVTWFAFTIAKSFLDKNVITQNITMTYMHSKVHGKWLNTSTIAKRHFTIFLPLFALTKPSSMLTGHGIRIAPLLLNIKGLQMRNLNRQQVPNHKLGKCQLCCPSSVYIRRKCLCLLVNA